MIQSVRPLATNRKGRIVPTVITWLLVLIASFLPQKGVSQSKVFEVFGDLAHESLGTSAVCTSPGVFIGVPGAAGPNGALAVGQVRVYNPTSGALLNTINFPQTPIGSESFGSTLLPIPDSNNNNIPELVISSPFLNSPDDVPRVFIFDQNDFQTPIKAFTGISTSEFGASVALLNYPTLSAPDSTPDIAIGAPNKCNGSISFCSSIGDVSIYNAQTGSLFTTILPPNGYVNFGASLTRVNDISNNGTNDLAVGAPGASSGDGSVFFYNLMAANSPLLIREIKGANLEAFGSKVIEVGDINNDTITDILVSAPKAASNTGSVSLYSGADIANSSIQSVIPLCKMTGIAPGDLFGNSLTVLNDQDKNGLNEFVIGSPGASGQIGAVVIYEYSTANGCSRKQTHTGTTVGDEFGKFLNAEPCIPSSASPFDLVVGSSSDKNGTDSGSTTIFSVQPTPTPTLTPTATPIEPSSSRLTFRISETGEFKIQTSYDQEPGDSCTHILYGRITVGSRKLPLIKIRSGQTHDAIENEDNKIIKILNFPTAEKIDGTVPVINMLLRTTCRGRSFDSNVFARFMNCGTPETTVPINQWVQTLIQALNSAEDQTSIRSDRILKVVRLKKRARIPRKK